MLVVSDTSPFAFEDSKGPIRVMHVTLSSVLHNLKRFRHSVPRESLPSVRPFVGYSLACCTRRGRFDIAVGIGRY